MKSAGNLFVMQWQTTLFQSAVFIFIFLDSTYFSVQPFQMTPFSKSWKIICTKWALGSFVGFCLGMYCQFQLSSQIYCFDFLFFYLIIISKYLFLQVGDFGLSRIKRNTLVSGGVRGTLPWMAPELLNGSSSRVSEKVSRTIVYILVK